MQVLTLGHRHRMFVGGLKIVAVVRAEVSADVIARFFSGLLP